jgi:hypothetical protein
VLLVVLWRRGPIDMDEPAPAMTEAVGDGEDVLADWSPPMGQPVPESAGDQTPPAGLERPAIEEAVEPGSDEVGIERESSQVGESEAAGEDEAGEDEAGEDEAGEDVDDTEPEELPTDEGPSPKEEDHDEEDEEDSSSNEEEDDEPPSPPPPPSGSLG